jgi:hypothetical protein
MAESNNHDDETARPPMEQPAPDPALRRLDRLVGTWKINGHTLDSEDDNITGRVAIRWMPGGFFLEQRGEIGYMGGKIESLEIISYDASTGTFPAYVYSSMDGTPLVYHWDITGNSVTHWTKGAKYTGEFSEDGTVLSGGWRPEDGQESSGSTAYDAIMTRMEEE